MSERERIKDSRSCGQTLILKKTEQTRDPSGLRLHSGEDVGAPTRRENPRELLEDQSDPFGSLLERFRNPRGARLNSAPTAPVIQTATRNQQFGVVFALE